MALVISRLPAACLVTERQILFFEIFRCHIQAIGNKQMTVFLCCAEKGMVACINCME